MWMSAEQLRVVYGLVRDGFVTRRVTVLESYQQVSTAQEHPFNSLPISVLVYDETTGDYMPVHIDEAQMWDYKDWA